MEAGVSDVRQNPACLDMQMTPHVSVPPLVQKHLNNVSESDPVSCWRYLQMAAGSPPARSNFASPL